MSEPDPEALRYWGRVDPAWWNGREVWTGYVKPGDDRIGPMLPRDMHEGGRETTCQVGPGGKALCQWCGMEVRGRRTRWCGDACIHECKLLNDWNYSRRQVEKRDRGVCEFCGIDTAKLSRILGYVAVPIGRENYCGRSPARPNTVRYGASDVAAELGFTGGHWWEADHVQSRSEGGEDHPRNLRTLCRPCHRARTAEQRRRWAKGKRAAEKAVPVGLFAGSAL